MARTASSARSGSPECDRPPPSPPRAWRGLPALALTGGCSGGAETSGASTERIVYGDDDRQEVFQVEADLQARATASVVALIPRGAIDASPAGLRAAPSFQESAGVCPGERFAAQPAAASCTGVLVDWDLVLTAAHCVRAVPLDELAVVFDYHYANEGVLATDGFDFTLPVDVVVSELDGPGSTTRLDYAWLRLAEPARPPHAPTPVYRVASPLAAGDPLFSISTGGGLPLKVDDGGQVRDAREGTDDCFLADTDTLHGSSGGGAFDAELALVGVMVRGADDFILSPDGCYTSLSQSDVAKALEQYTHAHRAVQGLCAADPSSSLCRAECEEPCQALPPSRRTRERSASPAGCQLTPHPCGAPAGGLAPLALLSALGWLRRSRLSGKQGRLQTVRPREDQELQLPSRGVISPRVGRGLSNAPARQRFVGVNLRRRLAVEKLHVPGVAAP
jgi:hypothetical protein